MDSSFIECKSSMPQKVKLYTTLLLKAQSSSSKKLIFSGLPFCMTIRVSGVLQAKTHMISDMGQEVWCKQEAFDPLFLLK